MVPLATAPAGPAEAAFRRTAALWGCSALVVVVTAVVLCVPDVRNLTRRTKAVAYGSPVAEFEFRSADAEGTAGRLG